MRAVAVLLCVVAAAVPATADDDEAELYGTVVDGGKLRINVSRAHPPAGASELSLRPVSPQLPAIAATALRTYRDSSESLAIVIVLSGQEVWVGNDQTEPAVDDSGQRNPAHLTGALDSIVDGFRAAKLVTRLPKDTSIGIVEYHDSVRVRAPLAPLARFDVAAFGKQLDYRNKLGSELVAGMTTGLAELRASGKQRRVMIVLGDGTDTNLDTAKARLAELEKDAKKDAVETYALTWKGALSPDEDFIEDHVDRATRVSRANVLTTAIPALIESLTNRYEVDFDVRSLPRDTPLTLALDHRNTSLGTIEMTFPGAAAAAMASTPAAAASTSPVRSIAFVTAGLGVVGLVFGWLAFRRARRESEDVA